MSPPKTSVVKYPFSITVPRQLCSKKKKRNKKGRINKVTHVKNTTMEIFIEFYINSDSNLTQTQMLTLKLFPNRTLTQTLT